MKKNLLFLLVASISVLASHAQCAAGYTAASLNWDNLDFLVQDASYISASQAQTQYFAFGTNRVTVNHNYSTANSVGETTNQTGKTGSYSNGADVEFSGNGTITITFNSAVENVKFSIQDVEKGQSMSLTAVNGVAPQNIVLSTCAAAGTTSLTLVNNATTNPSVTSLDGKNSIGDVNNNSNIGSFNVDIAGPVTSITIVTSIVSAGFNSTGSNPDFFLSDISACSNTAAFPNSYYLISRPFTNQPGYVLAAVNNQIMKVNPANGASTILFTDPAGSNINSMAYDPYNHFIYYTYSLTGTGGTVNPNNKSIKKYDVNTGVLSTIISNISTLGIPVYASGVESGGAAFYNGSYYLGIEGESGEESKIWQIDFDNSFNPITPAKQVFSIPTSGHDWSDFGISNGVLYDFDGSAGAENLYHISMQTGATLNAYATSALAFVPRQVSIDWNDKVYNTGTAATSSTGTIVPYANGAITTAQQYTITLSGTTPSGSWGDAAEAFKPKADFGDAASTYDPDPLAPALHELNPNLKLGATLDDEWNKTSSTNADADGTDEDGLPYVSILNQNSGNYLTQVDVYNNTGAPATVCAWVDFNNNGIFESGEGVSKTVQTGTAVQRIDLFWSGIATSLPAFSNVFMRIRITSASNLMTTANPTGYFANGEVEDYKVLVNQGTLPLKVTQFNAAKAGDDKVQIGWTSMEEESNVEYSLERSSDTRNWITILSKKLTEAKAVAAHQFLDASPATPISYYRLKYKEANSETRYTLIKKVDFTATLSLQISPNPATDHVQIELTADNESKCGVWLYSIDGKLTLTKQLTINKGYNKLFLRLAPSIVNGVYTAKIVMNEKVLFRKIVISK